MDGDGDQISLGKNGWGIHFYISSIGYKYWEGSSITSRYIYNLYLKQLNNAT